MGVARNSLLGVLPEELQSSQYFQSILMHTQLLNYNVPIHGNDHLCHALWSFMSAELFAVPGSMPRATSQCTYVKGRNSPPSTSATSSSAARRRSRYDAGWLALSSSHAMIALHNNVTNYLNLLLH